LILFDSKAPQEKGVMKKLKVWVLRGYKKSKRKKVKQTNFLLFNSINTNTIPSIHSIF